MNFPKQSVNLWSVSQSSKERTQQEPSLPVLPDKIVRPSVREVLAFGASIGIDDKYLERIYQETSLSGKNYWWSLLHELGHYAVKDDEYLSFWWQHGAPGSVPNLNFLRSNPDQIFALSFANPDQLDQTPNEQGVIAWTLGVLRIKGWTNPIKCPNWGEYCSKVGKDRSWQWSANGVYFKQDMHPLGDGFKQLHAVRISFDQPAICLRPKIKSNILFSPVARLDWRIA